MGQLSSSSVPFCSTSTCIIVVCLNAFMFTYLTNVEGFDSLIQLPHSGASRNRSRSKRAFVVNDYGAQGDGGKDDTKAFKEVWNLACSFSSSSEIVIPAGHTYLVRPIDFGGPCRSKLTLRISGNIIAPKDPDAWKGLNPHKWLYFHGVNHLTVEGEGTINGMGQEWWARSCKIKKTNPCRPAPKALIFHRCKNLKVRKFMMVNSQQMHLAFTNCVRVTASHLKVSAPASSPNTDGIHISSSTRVEVKDSIIRTGDDCISVVGNSSSIQISNIFCGPGHGISIGSLGKSKSLVKVHDVNVDGAFLSNTQNGVRIKTWQTLAVKVQNISFIAIKGTSATEEAIKFACSDTFPCEGIYLQDIQLVSYSGGSTRSFCWEARGSSLGLIYPPACFPGGESYIEQKVLSSSGMNWVFWAVD